MISPVSSTKTKQPLRFNPWLHSFAQALREGMALTIINAVLFVVAIAGFTFVVITERDGAGVAGYQSYRYFFFPEQFYVLLIPMLLELAIAQGVRAFGFLFSRKSSTAWFSLGLTRNSLFASRCAAGAVGTLIPVLLGMLGTLAVNLSLFQDAGLILSKFVFLLGGLSVQALALYAITAAVCCATATLGEGIGYSFVFMLLPTAVITALNALMLYFLFGNGYGFGDHDIFGGFNPALTGALAHLNPLLFMSPYVSSLANAQDGAAGMLSFGSGGPALPSNWLLVFAWLAAALAVAVIARLFFLRRQNEKAGVLGAGRFTAFVSVVTVAFCAFVLVFIVCLDVSGDQRMSTGAMLLVGGLSAAAALCAMAFPLRLISRPLWKSLLPLAGGLLAMYAVVGILCAGGLGFSSRVPNAQSVQNVTVTYHGLPLYLEFGTGSNDGGLAGSMDAQQTVTLTDPGDIASVLKIHRDFVQAGKLTGLTENMPPQGGVLGTVTTLSYVMKDGSVTIRSFTGATRAMIQNMLNLDSTAGVKKAYEDAILSPTNIFSGAQPYSQGNIFLWTPFYGESEPVGLDAEKRAELLQCIAADLSAQTVQDRYFPAEPETCLLVFQQEGESDAPDDPYERRLVYVTPGFTRTLSFLQANHFLDLLQQKKEIEYLGVVNFDKTQGGTISYGANNICLSFPNFINGTIRGTSDPYRNSGLEMPVTDPAQRQDILSHSHGLYNPIDGGYLVVIRYKGEDRFASAFLPMRDAPYFVKNGAK